MAHLAQVVSPQPLRAFEVPARQGPRDEPFEVDEPFLSKKWRSEASLHM